MFHGLKYCCYQNLCHRLKLKYHLKLSIFLFFFVKFFVVKTFQVFLNQDYLFNVFRKVDLFHKFVLTNRQQVVIDKNVERLLDLFAKIVLFSVFLLFELFNIVTSLFGKFFSTIFPTVILDSLVLLLFRI